MIDVEAIRSRTRKAQMVVAGLVPSEPNVGASTSDVFVLCAEVDRLRSVLLRERSLHCHRTCPTGDIHEAHCDDLTHELGMTR